MQGRGGLVGCRVGARGLGWSAVGVGTGAQVTSQQIDQKRGALGARLVLVYLVHVSHAALGFQLICNGDRLVVIEGRDTPWVRRLFLGVDSLLTVIR